MANSSNRIIDRYKSYITKSQRKKLQGMYPGYRQTTADELREQYLDNRRSMGRTGAVASAYGLGEGYIARKQADLDRVTDRYALQLGQQADSSFERQVVDQANQTIKARNEAARKAYERKLAAAKKKQAENDAAYKKYLRDKAAYEKALKEYNRQQKQSKNALRSGGAAKSINTANALEAWDAAHGEYYDPRFGRAGVYGSSGNVYTMPKAATPRNAWYEYYDPRFGRTGNYGSPDYGSAAPKQEDVVKRKKQAVMGTVTKPVFTVNPKVKMPVEPKMQKFIDAQVAEIEANPPAEIEKLKLNLTQEYERATSEYKDVLDATQFEASYGAQAQQLMTRYKELEQMATDTRYTPEQRRDYARTMQGIQQQYAQLTSYFKANVPHIHRSMEDLNRRYSELQVKRGVLAALGVTLDDQTLALNGSWLRQGNQIYSADLVQQAQTFTTGKEEDTAELRQHLYAIDKHNRHRGWGLTSWEIPPEEAQWLEANGYGWMNTTPELRSIEMAGDDAIPFSGNVEAYYRQINAMNQSYQRERNTTTKLMAFSRAKESEQKNAIAAGEQKTGLADILAGTSLEKAGTASMASLQGSRRAGSFADLASQIAKNLGLPKDYVTAATVEQLLQDEGSLAFIDYCYGIGDEQAAKDYLYNYTEVANRAQGEKIADLVSFNDAGKNASRFGEGALEAIRTVVEFMAQFGYGATGNFTKGVKRIFTNEDVPVSVGEAFSRDVTTNKTERGWNPFWAQAVDSAAVSAGNNAAAMLLGKGIGMVGSAIGGAVGGAIGAGTAKAASHAGSVLMGASAMGQAKQEALREGYGNKAATMYGLYNGISETILQEKVGGLVGLGDHGVFTKALGGLVNKIPSAMGRWGVNMVLDGLSEVGQELFGNVFENINRTVALGEEHGLFDNFKDEAGQTVVSTLLSTWLLNSIGLGGAVRDSRMISRIAKAANISKSDALMLMDVTRANMTGDKVDPKVLSKYNELTAVLTASMPENVAKAIADGKMTVADWVTSIPGMQRGMVTQKLAGTKNDVTEYDTTDHTEQYKALEGDNEALTNLLVTAKRTGKVGDAYYVTVDGKPIEISKLSTTEVANYILAQKTAKALKGSVDIVIHDTLPSDNGVMLADDGSVHVALDAMNSKGKAIIAYKTLVHEVGHALKVSNPGEWNSLKSKLYNAANKCKNGKGVTLYDACAKAVAAEYNPETNPDLYDEELFCTVAQELTGGDETSSWRAFLKDETIFDMIAKDKDLTAKEKKTFLDKFKDSLSKIGKQFSKLGATKEERQFMKWHDSVMPEIEKAYKSINERESLVEKAAKNPGNKANIEVMRKQAEEDAEVNAIIKDLDAKDANIVAAIDGLSGEDLTDEQFRALQRVIDKEEAEITPLGNPYNAEGVSPETMVEGTAVESQAQIPVKHSVKARNSIAQRTLETFHDHAENGKKRNSWKANGAITEDMLNAVYGTINEIAEEIEKNYAGKKDKNGMPLLPEETVLNNNIFPNSSYQKDAEPTSECYRQTIYFALNKMITDRLGRSATQKEAAIINQAAIEIGREAPCIYCYSLLDRKAKEAYKLQYLAERESFISALDERYHGDIEAFKKDRASAFDDLFSRYLAREFDPSAKDKKSSGKRKATEPQRKRLNLWLDLYEAYGEDGDYLTAESVRNPDAEIITRDELYNKYEGNELKLKERELTDIQTWIQDASQAKKVQTYAAYTNAGKGKQKLGGILSWSQSVINKLNREYGLRWYSHADYHPAFVIDNIQQITDASVRGLKGLMYCKPIEAAKIFAPTGMNINVSCFAKYVNGEYVVDDRLGANWTEVQKLREKYPNVGAVMVCTTEDMTMWALTQDWIDVVIPLHTVRSGSEFVEAFGLHDFSAEQADKLTDEQLYNEFVKKVCEEHDIRSSKGIEAVAKESKSIYPREHQNNYETYMAALNERGLTARFERIRKMVENGTAEYNGVKVTPEMYMKLVNETRQSDADTKPLVPNFDWDAARESIAQLPEKGYFDYFKDKVEIDGREMDVNQLADRAAEDIKAGKNPNELGYGETLANPGVVTRQSAKAEGLHGIHHQAQSIDVDFNNATDTEYLSLAEKYRDGTATEEEKAELEKRVEEAAKEAGYNSPKLYHGTKAFGFTVFKNSDTGAYFFTNRPETASTYSGKETLNNVNEKVRKDRTGSRRGNYSVYLRTDKLLTVDCMFRNWDDIAIDAREVDRTDGRFYGLKVKDGIRYSSKDYTSTNDIVTFAEEKGYDGVVFRNLRDNSSENPRYRSIVEGGKGEKLGVSDVYAVFDSSQIKSADPVTYDDNGDIIPLSERFRTDREGDEAWKNEDIRYQQRNVDVDFNSKQDVDAEIDKLMDKIRDIQNAKLQADEAAKKDPRVQEAQQKMWAAEDAGGRVGSVRERMEYKRILKQVKDEQAATIPEGDLNELSQRVQELKQLREQFLKVVPISAEQYDELANYFGTTKDYNVAGFILPDGRMLDFSGRKQYGKDYAGGREVYHNEVGEVLELNEDTSPRINMVANGNIRLVPEINGINLSQKPSAEQLSALRGFIRYHNGDVRVDIDNAAGRTVETFGYYKGTSEAKIVSDINKYFETGEAPAPQSDLAAFRYQSRNVDVDFFPTEKKERKYSTEGVNAQGRNYASRREADARLAERMHEGAIRARIERKAGETEQAYKERIKKIYEDRYRREIKNTALKWNKNLVDMLARPTENKHVPVQLARSVAEFCEEVTKYLDGTTKRGEKILDKIRKAYDRAFTDEQTILRAKSEDAGYDARGAVLNTSQKDEQLAEMLKELSDITAEKSFAELTRDEMDALLNVVRGVAYAVTDANKMIGEAEGKTVWQTGSTMIEQLENAPKVSSKLRGYLATSLDLRRLARIFSGSNEDAEFVKLVEQLNQGAIEKERIAQELQAIFKPVTDEYGNEIKKWYGKKAEWLDTGIVTKDGVPVKITKGMRVSLALHVLNEGNMRHIERGGLTIPEAKLYAQGKLADAYANGKLVRLTAEQINDIIANMTEAEKAYVEAAKELFHDRAGFYVNKTSLQLAGYTKANVENYFPIHTDKNFNKTDFASMSMDGSIEGQGFLKERVAASNPVYLEDITSVVNRQIRGVALYAGMAIPVRNFNAVMNAAAYEDENGNWVPRTTVKQTLAKTMGEYGAKVVEGFVEDASEMSQRVDVTPVERIAGKLATNYVKAVLLGNLKVAMKQVASYPTAAAVIPWKYLNKALVAGGKNHRIISRADVDLINKYTPLYQMRREGNANEVASLMNKPGMEQKLPWLLGWITKMDVMTVGRLWSAAEYMVEDTHKDLTKGSDEFYREVAKVFNQTIQQTQPNFTPLQRNAALRSKNPIVRSLTLFGTQRMQNGGILIEAAYELKQAKGKSAEEIAAARRKLGRAVASQVVQNFLLLAATLAVDALRGRMKQWQDDDDELTPESIASKMGDTFLSNFLGSFLGGSEFYETISNMYKKANGQTTYDTEFSVPALDAIETIMSFGQSGIPNFINYLNGDHTDEEKLNKLKSFSMEMAKVAGYATGLPLENAVKDVFKGFIPAYKDIRDWKKTGELIPYLWQSGKLDNAKTRARYEDWIDSGHKGSEFFALDKQLKNAVGGRDGRAEILWNESNLSPEDKAFLMEMYDTSGGYADGSKFFNKNDKELYDFAAEPKQETEAPTETPAEEIAEIPAATEAPAASEAPAATTAPKSDKYTKAAEKWSPYGVTASQAKAAVEKWEQIGNASEYRAWLSKQNYTGRQKFAMYAQANADTEKKAVDFNKKYGTKFEALWNAYAKYDSNSFHGEEYRSWVEKQTSDYRQRFSLVEFAEPRSNWIEHAEELHKAGVSYEAVWKAARYAKNQSGTGKKDRIIAYAKKLGMSTKQAENIYKWFG